MQQKDYSRAILEYRNASQIRPKDAEPYYRLGLAYEQMGNLNAAVSAIREALQKDAKHAGAQLKLTELMANYGNGQVLAEAEKRLEGLVQNPSKDPQALETLAIAEFRLGKADEAGHLLEQAVVKYPSELEPAVLLAQLKLRQNDLAGAQTVLKNAAAAFPKSADAALVLGRFYLRANRPEQAEPELRRALSLHPQFAPALLSLALLESSRNRPDLAEPLYQQLSTGHDPEYQPLYGLFLYQRGKTDAALKEMQRLAREAPDDRAARSRLVAFYVTIHRKAEAEKLLTAALSKNTKDTDALLQRAALYLLAGDFAKAEVDLDRAVHNRPDSTQVHFEIAMAKRLQGLPSSERQELLQAVMHDPTFLPARLALGRNYLAASEHKAALDMLDNTPGPLKTSREIRVERNWALLGINDQKTARVEIDRLLAEARTPDALEQDGFLKMMQRDFAGARQDAEDILAQTPEDSRAIRLLVDSYLGAHQRTAVLVRLRDLAGHNLKSAPVQYLVGENLLAAGERDGAKMAFQAALAADPKFTQAQIALGHIDFLENRLDAARERLAAVIAAEPRNVMALSAAGDIELRSGNYAEALEKYRAVLDVDPSNVLALLASSTLMVTAKNLDEARKLAEHAVELAPDDPRAQETLGWVQYSAGNYSSAAEHLKQAVQVSPTPSRQYHLALTYLKSGQETLGRTTLAAALKKEPDLPKKDRGW